LKAVESGKLAVQIPSLITEKGETITETFLIAQYLLSLQPLWNEFFLGKTE
jgi:glutathione S-transferase